MKAIRTRYVGPTNTRGSRYTATDADGNRVSLAASYALDSDGNHKRAAQALMEKIDWPNELVGGGFGNDMYWTMLPYVDPICSQCGNRKRKPIHDMSGPMLAGFDPHPFAQ